MGVEGFSGMFTSGSPELVWKGPKPVLCTYFLLSILVE